MTEIRKSCASSCRFAWVGAQVAEVLTQSGQAPKSESSPEPPANGRLPIQAEVHAGGRAEQGERLTQRVLVTEGVLGKHGGAARTSERSRPIRATSSARRATGRTMSTWPVAMALRGIPSNAASSGSWANVSPPCSRTACTPSDPSEPVPERTTAMASLLWCSASARRKPSIGMGGRAASRGKSRSTAPETVNDASGGMTCTWFGDNAIPS